MEVPHSPIILQNKPAPVLPAEAKIYVITPDLTKQWNTAIDNNNGLYYTYYGFDEKGLVNFGQWMNSVNAHIQELNAIISYYEEEIKRRNNSQTEKKAD